MTTTPENPFEGLAEEIGQMMKYKRPAPEEDDRVDAFELSDEELAYLRGETDEVPDSMKE